MHISSLHTIERLYMKEIEWYEIRNLIKQMPIYRYAIAHNGMYLTIDGFEEGRASEMLLYPSIEDAKSVQEMYPDSIIVILEVDFEDYVSEQ